MTMVGNDQTGDTVVTHCYFSCGNDSGGLEQNEALAERLFEPWVSAEEVGFWLQVCEEMMKDGSVMADDGWKTSSWSSWKCYMWLSTLGWLG